MFVNMPIPDGLHRGRDDRRRGSDSCCRDRFSARRCRIAISRSSTHRAAHSRRGG